MITLGIIGIVAAFTIPNIVSNYRAKVLRTQYLKTYAILSRAVQQMYADGVPTGVEAKNYFSYPNPRSLHKHLMANMKVIVFCGIGSSLDKPGCPTFSNGIIEEYKSFDGTMNASSSYVGGSGGTDENSQNIGTSFFLSDGTLIFTSNDFWGNHLYISADINGIDKSPNRYGYDLFTFELKDGKFLPMGNDASSYPGWADHTQLCRWTAQMSANGHSCTQKAHEDPDYFKKVLRGSWR